MTTTSRFRLITVGEWPLVAPATIFIVAGVMGRLLGCNASMVTRWTAVHISPAIAAIMFLGMPAAVIAAGSLAIAQKWRNVTVRGDMIVLRAIVLRRFAFLLTVAAIVLAAAILGLALGHRITD